MENNIVINIIFSFILILIGLMFIEGTWRKEGRIIKSGINVDSIFFPNVDDKRLLKLGDQLSFLICAFMALLTLINGLLLYFFQNVPNVSAIFIFIAIILTWPIKIIFIYSIKRKGYNDAPRIWPFKK